MAPLRRSANFGNARSLDQVGRLVPNNMKSACKWRWFALCPCLITGGAAFAAEVPAAPRAEPSPRPRLTEALRLKVEQERTPEPDGGAVKMDKVIVREGRMPVAPPKEQERAGQFSITQGGYVLKKHGDKFSTEVGLWRHIDIIEDPRDQLRQSERIRMSFLRFSW